MGSRRHFSPIVRRILTVNVMALAILVGSLLYLGRYQDRIIATEIDSLLLQSRIIASAVTENAVVVDDNDADVLSPLLARLMVRRLAETTETRTRLFDADGTLLADSRVLLSGKNKVRVEGLEPAKTSDDWGVKLAGWIFSALEFLHKQQDYPLLEEQEVQRGDQYEAVRGAVKNLPTTQIWRDANGHLTLAAAVPVEHYKRALGVVMMTRSDENVLAAITSVRIDILKIFGITLAITILLSFYLARAIARPIRLLALAAEGMRQGQMQIVGLVGTAKMLDRDAIPDMTHRHDEIGDLSGALRELTGSLAQRIGAIENFAADVAHEIKNPLTSLRSAVETAERVQDPASRQKLMAVIHDDVARLDRLISDISNASRLDAELSRAEARRFDINKKLRLLIEHINQANEGAEHFIRVVFDGAPDELIVSGIENRFMQVFQNVIDNAQSFSPQQGVVRVATLMEDRGVLITIEDQGPGIPANKLQAIFDRFYSERPRSEKFGLHSGLGLSISKQIIEAHRGRIWAENYSDTKGNLKGARFYILIPAAD
jgi:two-component system sensor histidine kinase ChvG